MGFQDSVPLEDFPRQPLGLEIHFGRLRYGYIWVFPDNERVRIGAGVLGSPASPSDVVNTLTEFMRNLHLPTSELQLQGAPIPSLVLSEDLGRDNLYLAGDAAGMVDHVSGEGMGHALESGLLVAQCILASGRRENVLGSAGNCISLVKESIRYRHLLYSRLTRGVAMMSLRDSEIFAECYWDIISGIGTYDDMFRRILE
jgi:menaquinone-9 beta-reductase